jgi:hypothetical protein
MCPCDCELVDQQPRSKSTLKLTNGPVRIGSIREIVEYECTRCGAKLELLMDEWAGDSWRRVT